MTATVFTSPALWQSATPSLLVDATLDSLAVERHTSEAAATNVESLAHPETVMQACSATTFAPAWVEPSDDEDREYEKNATGQ
jgi:hypothetical protein